MRQLALALPLLAAAPLALAQTPDPVGGEFLVNSYTTGGQDEPVVAAGPDGGFVVVWGSGGSPAGDTDASIQGQRYDEGASPLGSQFQVNSYTTGLQDSPAVAVGSAGDFVVVWQSLGSAGGDTSSFSIQAQPYDAAGGPLGGELQVNGYTLGPQRDQQVAKHPDGGFVVVWGSTGSDEGDSSSTSVHGRRYDANGDPLGGQFQVNSYTTGSQARPAVAAETAGGFVVVWESVGSDGGDTSGASIQGQRYDADGDPLGAQFQVNAYTTDDQNLPAVAADAAGGFIVLWRSDGSAQGDTSGLSVQARRFDANGDPLGGELQVNAYTTGDQQGASVSPEPAGGFVVVWQSDGSAYGDTSSSSVQGRRLDANGDPLGDQFQVNTYTTDFQLAPSVAVGSQGDALVVWDSDNTTNGDGDGTSIQGQRFRLPAVGDRVWQDTDRNGVQDGGESGVAGVTVTLFADDGTELRETTTDADGVYGFGVAAGDYYLGFTAPAGFAFTARDAADDDLDSDANAAGVTIVFTVDATDLTRDAGLVATAAVVGDRVWLDADGNGVQNGGEVGLAGVAVSLYREPDAPFLAVKAATLAGSDVTDADGFYSFAAPPGTYYLEFTCPGATFTGLDQGASDALDSDVEPSLGTTSPFVLAAFAADATRDAGLLDPDGDGAACPDNCPVANPDQADADGDGAGDACDLCAGDDAEGDADGDGLCADLDCDDADAGNACAIFDDGFESGDGAAWSSTVP